MFNMDNKQIIKFIRTNLLDLMDAKDCGPETIGKLKIMLSLLDAEFPDEIVKLSIVSIKDRSLISAINLVRQHTGLGLYEAKVAVEQGKVFLTTNDIKKAMAAYKDISVYAKVGIQGNKAITALFGDKDA